MSKPIDLIGKRFDRLIVVGLGNPTKSGQKTWLCNCLCGKAKEIRHGDLMNGKSSSCGCSHKEMLQKRSRIHGMSRKPIYNTWISMKARCLNPSSTDFESYGGRGINICKEWLDFENFYADMGDRPKGLSLDRINNMGNYEPSNCRWADSITQANNRRPRNSSKLVA
jgi:hypothetical protein